MEKKEKRPGYFTRLKKKRHLKHKQTEEADAELDQSEAESGATPVCADAVIGQALEKNPESGQSTSRSEGAEDAGRRSRRRERRRPSGTAEYLVGPSDTLNSVALKFNITPNNLVHLNRLFSHSLVPGQTLFVPDVDAVCGSSQDTSGCDPALVLPACRGASPPSEDESPSLKFIKMSCKYFTDGMGVVGGVMIVTPNNIMFDPHKSDPLVIEHGCEEYGLLCPMEEVLSIALYDDVSRMKLKDSLPSDEPRDLCPLYRPGEWEELPSERDLNPFSRFQAPPHGPAPDQSPSDEGFTELELPPSDCPGACPGAAEEDEDEGLHNRSTEETPGVEVEDSGKCSPKESEGPSVEAERRRRASEAEMKSWLLKRMQGPIENLLLSAEQKSKAPPMFLCFKVGKPMIKSFAIGQASSPALSWACQGRQAEYWFAVPQERVEQLYSFFIQWSPDAYGNEAQDHGFVVVDKDELPMIDNFFSDPLPRSWEIITINEAKRRQSFCLQDEEPLDLLPVLLDTSALLQDTHLQKLAPRLPARVLGRGWRVIYSTEVHGTSLKTLYRCSAELEEPVLLVIRDMNQQVFGAFSTHPFRVSEHCYGTGETFLYSFCPEIKVFRWTGENSYFVKGNTDSLQIGGGGGRLGLWLDADLHHGTTSRCSTFNNPPLTDSQDFTVQNLEVWTFE